MLGVGRSFEEGFRERPLPPFPILSLSLILEEASLDSILNFLRRPANVSVPHLRRLKDI
jgi:hypothetical protein